MTTILNEGRETLPVWTSEGCCVWRERWWWTWRSESGNVYGAWGWRDGPGPFEKVQLMTSAEATAAVFGR